jgi:hypothetical protein
VKIWGLWSSRVDMYSEPELLGLFADRADAERTKAGLIGHPKARGLLYPVWEDDEDFPDLYVREMELH